MEKREILSIVGIFLNFAMALALVTGIATQILIDTIKSATNDNEAIVIVNEEKMIRVEDGSYVPESFYSKSVDN